MQPRLFNSQVLTPLQRMSPLRVSSLCTRSLVQVITGGHRLLSAGVVKVHEEVQEAVHAGKAVVALESAIITHGMPRPANLQTAHEVESVMRERGVTPATVAVLQGQLHVGLTASQLDYLSGDTPNLVKVSRRDFPYVLSQKLSGGTTVSATMVAAHRTGIPIFVTGGIGGVHRGAEHTLDMSADLTELGRTPVTVISAGVKSILDIAKTLEYLETQGVCVSTFGDSRDFPAFFTPRSGLMSPYVLRDPTEAASLILAGQKLNLENGNLIAVPIPEEFFSTGEIIESAIQEAVKEAKEQGVGGKDVTPFILQRLNQLTHGQSLHANVVLVKNNAVVGSQIALELSRLKEEEKTGPVKSPLQSCDLSPSQPRKAGLTVPQHRGHSCSIKTGSGRPVVVGGVLVDYISKMGVADFKLDGATYPGQVYQSLGGVGRNLADCLARLGHDPLLISVVGDGPQAEAFFAYSRHMDCSGIRILPGERTSTYSAFLRKSGQLLFGIGDMAVHKKINPELICQFEQQISIAPIVCMDGNITSEAISYLCDLCSYYRVPVCYEPTDIHKAIKPFLTSAGEKLTYTSPNLSELRLMYTCITGKELTITESSVDIHSKMTEAAMLCEEVTLHLPVVMVTLGKDGVLLCHRLLDEKLLPIAGEIPQLSDQMRAVHIPACIAREEDIVSVSGAGDCLVSATISGILRGHGLEVSVRAGMLAALTSLRSVHPVPHDISANQLTEDFIKKQTLESSVFKY